MGISAVLEIGGYVPLVGSCIGAGRMAVGGTAAIVGGVAFAVLGYITSEKQRNQCLSCAGWGAHQFFKGMIEIVPFVKLAMKVTQIWNHNPHAKSLSVI